MRGNITIDDALRKRARALSQHADSARSLISGMIDGVTSKRARQSYLRATRPTAQPHRLHADRSRVELRLAVCVCDLMC